MLCICKLNVLYHGFVESAIFWNVLFVQEGSTQHLILRQDIHVHLIKSTVVSFKSTKSVFPWLSVFCRCYWYSSERIQWDQWKVYCSFQVSWWNLRSSCSGIDILFWCTNWKVIIYWEFWSGWDDFTHLIKLCMLLNVNMSYVYDKIENLKLELV